MAADLPARQASEGSLVVGIGIAGNLAGYPLLDPIAALIVGLMVARMGWGFAWDALHDLMDRAADEQEARGRQSARPCSKRPACACTTCARARWAT